MITFVISGFSANEFKSGLKGNLSSAQFVFDFAKYIAKYNDVNLYIKGNEHACLHENIMFRDINELKPGHFRGKGVYIYSNDLPSLNQIKHCFIDCTLRIFNSPNIKGQYQQINSVLGGNEIVFLNPCESDDRDELLTNFQKDVVNAAAKAKLLEIKNSRLELADRQSITFLADISSARATQKTIFQILKSAPNTQINLITDSRCDSFFAELQANESVKIIPFECSVFGNVLFEISKSLLFVYAGVGNSPYSQLLSYVSRSSTPWMSTASVKASGNTCSAPDYYCGIDPVSGAVSTFEASIEKVLHGLKKPGSKVYSKWLERLERSATSSPHPPDAEQDKHEKAAPRKVLSTPNSLYDEAINQVSDPNAINVVWIGRFNFVGGYGEVARGYLQAMEAVNMRHLCIDIEKKQPIGKTNGIFFEHDPENRCFHIKSPALLVINDLPTKYSWFKGQGFISRVGCTLFETDSFPVDWVEGLSFVDEMWVPTEFNKSTFSNSGIPEDKISVIQYSIDTDYFTPAEAREHDTVRLLYIVSNLNRKDPGLLLRSYFRAFSRDDNVCLTIKTRMSEERFIDAMRVHLEPNFRFDDPENPEVRLVTGTISNDGIRNLYAESDLYVTTERAKGWDYPAMEAMAMGIPCVSLDWSGSEFLNDQNAFLIPVKGNLTNVHSSQVDNAEMYFGHKWADVEESQVVETLKKAVQNKDERLRKGKQSRQDTFKYSAPEIGKQMRKLLQDKVGSNHGDWATLNY